MKTRFLSFGFIIGCLGFNLVAQAAESDRVAPSTLRFLPNGIQSVEGVVLSGQSLHLEYDPIRLSQCRGKNSAGVEEWTVQAFLSIDGEAPLALDLIEGRGTLFPYAVPLDVIIPDGKRLDIWFKASDVTGCVQWDSQNNLNYSHKIYRLDELPVISFHGNWQITQEGVLKAGQPVRLHYDLDRATQCRTGGYHGSASWDVTAQIRVDGAAVPAQKMTFTKSWSERGQQDVVQMLPAGQELTIWFENSGYEYYAGRACMAYDSNFGKNYRFPLH